jgi:hypothetical protein
LPEERLVLGLIITGGAIEENRAVADREVDFFDLKGAMETGVDWMGLSPLVYTKGEAKHLRSGQASAISLQTGEKVGSAGRLSEAIASCTSFASQFSLLNSICPRSFWTREDSALPSFGALSICSTRHLAVTRSKYSNSTRFFELSMSRQSRIAGEQSWWVYTKV